MLKEYFAKEISISRMKGEQTIGRNIPCFHGVGFIASNNLSSSADFPCYFKKFGVSFQTIPESPTRTKLRTVFGVGNYFYDQW